MWCLVKTPSPFKWRFQTLSFFPLIVFPSAGFTPWSKNSHERGKGKGKGIVKEGKGKNSTGRGKGKRKEKERKRKRKGKGKGKEKESNRKRKGNWKKRQCLTRTIFDAKRYRYRFVIVRESCVCVCVCSFFAGNGCNHQKRSVAATYQAPSLCRICAITTTNNERKRPKALNSRRMMDKWRTLDFKSLDTYH